MHVSAGANAKLIARPRGYYAHMLSVYAANR